MISSILLYSFKIIHCDVIHLSFINTVTLSTARRTHNMQNYDPYITHWQRGLHWLTLSQDQTKLLSCTLHQLQMTIINNLQWQTLTVTSTQTSFRSNCIIIMTWLFHLWTLNIDNIKIFQLKNLMLSTLLKITISMHHSRLDLEIHWSPKWYKPNIFSTDTRPQFKTRVVQGLRDEKGRIFWWASSAEFTYCTFSIC